MDCTEHPRTCGKFDVEGYPAIKIFDSSVVGPPEEYEGERTLDGLLEYVLYCSGSHGCLAAIRLSARKRAVGAGEGANVSGRMGSR